MNNRRDYTEYAPPFGRGKIRKPVWLLTAQFFMPAHQKKTAFVLFKKKTTI